MADRDLYQEFVERYFDSGTSELPETWPEETRELCHLFLKLVGGLCFVHSMLTALCRRKECRLQAGRTASPGFSSSIHFRARLFFPIIKLVPPKIRCRLKQIAATLWTTSVQKANIDGLGIRHRIHETEYLGPL